MEKMEDITIKDYTISYYLYYFRVYTNINGQSIQVGHFDSLSEALKYVARYV